MDKHYPQHWRVVREQLDAALSWYYEEMADTDTKVSRLLVRMQQALGLYADPQTSKSCLRPTAPTRPSRTLWLG